jgi:hypothetical protein
MTIRLPLALGATALGLAACGGVSAAPRAIPAVVTPAAPSANPWALFGRACYGTATTIVCTAPGQPDIVEVDVWSVPQCIDYAGMVAEGTLAPEAVYDPASPCARIFGR